MLEVPPDTVGVLAESVLVLVELLDGLRQGVGSEGAVREITP